MAELAKKVMKKLTEEVERKGLKLSVTRPKREKQDDCVMRLFGGRAASVQQTWSDAGRLGNVGCRLEKKSQELGSKRKSEKGEMHSEILACQEEQGLPKKLHEGGSQEVVTSGYGASKNLESSCSGDSSYEKGLN